MDNRRKRVSESDSASEHGGKGDGRRGDEQELDSKSLQLGLKRFYVDVKQNWHGRFIKLAEVGPINQRDQSRRKSRVLFSMPAADVFIAHLDDMLTFLAGLPKFEPKDVPKTTGGERPPQPEPLKVIKMDCSASSEHRLYTIECRENNRGRFVRVAMTTAPGGASLGGRGIHSVVQVADSGVRELRDALSPLVAKWNKDLPEDKSYKGDMPDTRSLRVGAKTFYFDYGQTQRGVYMRLSEVKPSWRTSVSVPRSEWEAIRDIFTEACKVVDRDEGTHNDKP